MDAPLHFEPAANSAAQVLVEQLIMPLAVANLDELPPVGATMIAAVSKVRGATGRPTRVLGLIHRGR